MIAARAIAVAACIEQSYPKIGDRLAMGKKSERLISAAQCAEEGLGVDNILVVARRRAVTGNVNLRVEDG